ncbi:MAG: triphosphoribosyl-dephospho-CoA synthase [Nitrososphaerota archaeon]
MKAKELLEHIRFSAELAATLEVSGWPKPGNVHRSRNYSATHYEHFLAGSISLGYSIESAALKGFMVAKNRLDISKIGIGKLIKKAILNIKKSHKGGNTHLGICLLFIPLAAAAAKTYIEIGNLSLSILQNNVKKIIQSTTPKDAISVYEAISLVSSPHELGKVNSVGAPDIYDKKAYMKILKNNISLFDTMKESSSYDTIAKELVTGMKISFNIGYKELIETFNHTNDINIATVHTFLKILSKVPDTFIARRIGLRKVSNIKEAVKIGIEETIWISETAEKILKLGGLTTEKGTKLLWDFDHKLQNLGENYNPGTTADLTANSLFIALLHGLKF